MKLHKTIYKITTVPTCVIFYSWTIIFKQRREYWRYKLLEEKQLYETQIGRWQKNGVWYGTYIPWMQKYKKIMLVKIYTTLVVGSSCMQWFLPQSISLKPHLPHSEQYTSKVQRNKGCYSLWKANKITKNSKEVICSASEKKDIIETCVMITESFRIVKHAACSGCTLDKSWILHYVWQTDQHGDTPSLDQVQSY